MSPASYIKRKHLSLAQYYFHDNIMKESKIRLQEGEVPPYRETIPQGNYSTGKLLHGETTPQGIYAEDK